MKLIWNLEKELWDNVDGIQDKIKSLKDEQEANIVRRFSSILNKMKKSIEEKTSIKGAKAADIKGRENELNHHLELITNIAQRIENENWNLMEKNWELKAEYKA